MYIRNTIGQIFRSVHYFARQAWTSSAPKEWQWLYCGTTRFPLRIHLKVAVVPMKKKHPVG